MRYFQGKEDKSVVLLEGVFPGSDLVFSTPLEFSAKRSGVFVEGDYGGIEKLFNYLAGLVNSSIIDEGCFGRWIAVTPPETDFPRTIIHYEAANKLEKIRLLTFTLREHLAKICNLYVSTISILRVRFEGREIQKSWIALPANFINGNIKIVESVETKH